MHRKEKVRTIIIPSVVCNSIRMQIDRSIHRPDSCFQEDIQLPRDTFKTAATR